jgi:lysophospholipase L1-like esterase
VSRRAAAAAPLIFCVTACGGGGSPAAPPDPGPVYDLVAIVFYDENGDGRADPTEIVRVGDVEVQAGTRSARSANGSGRAVITGVPAGSPSVTVRASTLPSFYTAPAPVPATVPQPAGNDVMVPVTLPIGGNRPNTYMGFGDSITVGEGSSDDAGYRDRLEAKLHQHFGRADVINQGLAGTRSNFGAARIDASLGNERPAYTLILYGTNDWNQNECKTAFPCFTIESLRQMVRAARFFQSLPLLATIPPCNVGQDDRATPERQEFIHKMDELIRPMAVEEGAVLVDLEKAFLEQPSLAALFVDHIHPNDAGYDIIANEFFEAITRPAAAGAAAAPEPPARFGVVAPAGVATAPRAAPGRAARR